AHVAEIRHTDVVKNLGTTQQPNTAPSAGRVWAAGSEGVAAHAPAGSEGRTRDEVARLLLEEGPMTAAAIATRLTITPAAVRRHLDGLVAAEEARVREESPHVRRGRGRPAKLYLLTEAGRARFGHAYDDLAVAALRHLAEYGGQE